ncbi:MAG: STAS/SEC14 domain-containing protein [Deltaproteobacteria bacterium]|jgi:hypothetical protein
MIEYTLDKERSVLHVRPTGRLRESDFDTLAQADDPYIEQTGGLSGLIIEAARFPGREDLGAAVRHFRFVREHHRKIRKVAVVTDSLLGDAVEHIASHFVGAKIKRFPAGAYETAKTWIVSESKM